MPVCHRSVLTPICPIVPLLVNRIVLQLIRGHDDGRDRGMRGNRRPQRGCRGYRDALGDDRNNPRSYVADTIKVYS
jgi:hypothetical protein